MKALGFYTYKCAERPEDLPPIVPEDLPPVVPEEPTKEEIDKEIEDD